jgi:hypothetical protein
MAESSSNAKPFRVGEEPRPEGILMPVSASLSRLPEAGQQAGNSSGRQKAKSRLKTLRNFVTFDLRALRPAEINVWLVIFNCEFRGVAQIGYDRIAELTGKSKKSVSKAVNNLIATGLLDRPVRGQFRPGSSRGQSSVYRIHAHAEPQGEEVQRKPK